MKVLFHLCSSGGGGGAHSVIQESLGMARLGAAVAIVTDPEYLQSFRGHYPEIEDAGLTIFAAGSPTELAVALDATDVVCATGQRSIARLQAALPHCGTPPRIAYYVQDYEPLFRTPGDAKWHEARASYAAIPDALLFAKTRWLCEIVCRNTGIEVRKVPPSLDHDIYFSDQRGARPRPAIAAMIRPSTPRRAPRRTARVLAAILARRGDAVDLHVFGADPQEMREHGILLPAAIEAHGPLRRTDVAELLRGCDLFLDLSDYQAFGRTALEAMACGCVPMVPLLGGADEFARHWRNAIQVDTRSDAAILEEVEAFLALPPRDRERLRSEAIGTALDFSVAKAAHGELSLFRELIGQV